MWMNVKSIAIAALSAGALGLGTAPTIAEQTASASSCLQMADQVKSALDSHAKSPNYESAVRQEIYGREFCSQGYYKVGTDHYSQALKLLGATKA